MTATNYANESHTIERWDTVFKAVAAEPRRQIIVSLLDAPPDESVPLPESAQNPNAPRDPETLRQELYHAHLPMLSEMEFVVSESDPMAAARGRKFVEVATVFVALHAEAADIPDTLVAGCQRLEAEQSWD